MARKRDAADMTRMARAGAAQLSAGRALAMDSAAVLGRRLAPETVQAGMEEMARMAPEKVQAFAAAGVSLGASSLEMTTRAARFAADEAAAAAGAGREILAARTPVEAAALQAGYAWGLFNRMVSFGLVAGAAAAEAQVQAVRPVRKALTQNRRRLGV